MIQISKCWCPCNSSHQLHWYCQLLGASLVPLQQRGRCSHNAFCAPQPSVPCLRIWTPTSACCDETPWDFEPNLLSGKCFGKKITAALEDVISKWFYSMYLSHRDGEMEGNPWEKMGNLPGSHGGMTGLRDWLPTQRRRKRLWLQGPACRRCAWQEHPLRGPKCWWTR